MESKAARKQKPANTPNALAECVVAMVGPRPRTAVELVRELIAKSPQRKTPIVEHAFRIVTKDILDQLLVEGRVFIDVKHRYRVATKVKHDASQGNRHAIETLKKTIMAWVTNHKPSDDDDTPSIDHLSSLPIDSELLNLAIGELVGERKIITESNSDLMTVPTSAE